MQSKTTSTPDAALSSALALACALFVFACGGEVEPRKNVVLIVVDTMRASRTSLHGYERATTPRIAEWAQGGAVFERAQAPSSWTIPSLSLIHI